ncbi:hypothetical protein KR032_001228, partial [Drosophila birchii]
LEKIEKKWEKDLEEKLSTLSTNYDTLEEKLSAIERQVKNSQVNAQIVDNDDELLLSARQPFKKIGEKYYLIEEENPLSWEEATNNCFRRNAQLVSLQNEQEWDAIRQHLDSDKNYWVDVNDIEQSGRYVSGYFDRKAPFLIWEAREPNQLTSEHCVELRRDYNHYMNDIICSQENYYICERSSAF